MIEAREWPKNADTPIFEEDEGLATRGEHRVIFAQL
jgi:hypothetical protein